MSMKKMLAVAAAAALVAVSAPAFAANPFMDVPMNSWAYDAIDQLHARGVISGYPDGSFKGNKPITRYEMASMVARAMAYMEENNLAAEDMEVLKRLMVEFKDELDALGVRVDDIDGRLAKMEENLGGWKIWGELRFDANWRDDSGDSNFSANRVRLWLSKDINENISFRTRIRNRGNEPTGQDMEFNQFYMDVKDLFGGFGLRVGRWSMDWEDDDGLYIDNDAIMTDVTQSGFLLSKDFGIASVKAFATDGAIITDEGVDEKTQATQFGFRARMDFNEKFWLSLNAVWKDYDTPVEDLIGTSNTYWGALGFKFTPAIELKGVYFTQDNTLAGVSAGMDDSPAAWKAILDIDQEALKFTSLWVEYAQFDQGFFSATGGVPFDEYDDGNARDYSVTPIASRNGGIFGSDVDVLFVKAEQRWSEKFATYERFALAEDAVGLNAEGTGGGTDDVTNWTFGVKWFYHPSLTFDLSYDDIDYGDSDYRGGSDNVIRFRTHLYF